MTHLSNPIIALQPQLCPFSTNQHSIMCPAACPTNYFTTRAQSYYSASHANISRSSNFKFWIISFRSLVNKMDELYSFTVLHAPNIVIGWHGLMILVPPLSSISQIIHSIATITLRVMILSFDTDMKMIGDNFNPPPVSWLPPSEPAGYEGLLTVINISGFRQYIVFPTRGDDILDLLLSKDCSSCIITQLPYFFIWSCYVHADLALNTVQTVNSGSSFLNFNHSTWPFIATSIRLMEWSIFFSSFFVTSALSSFLTFFQNTVIWHAHQLVKTTFEWCFLNPLARSKLVSIKRRWFSTGDPFVLSLLTECWSAHQRPTISKF